ncbi:MAG: hypothetical protein A3I24_01440 [Candidatus Harrisonbacteria bacterium RIFCSPLOWO2_02_FULL_41_13b]|uniref:Uncharacterized protein n=1 Tax=Candidatus Harrisonbacteria bacterium RIFCSPLOWO2_02_FULL_41_13b TaxID=1798409 RepID=A0A1G1ZTL3_9BACT|nr:MAG: hypothetical protein A3J53_02085 [Candidatus Harrisonbacteria bacterium RIFCSPHIGHO2_02_FULL_40_20]OGY67819.1 MAG: hypothetical protein A3I24_01440 [Candidatus Harrisonbacteria bacterium RIFCSPLOWO2_02_FULL_41_13b]
MAADTQYLFIDSFRDWSFWVTGVFDFSYNIVIWDLGFAASLPHGEPRLWRGIWDFPSNANNIIGFWVSRSFPLDSSVGKIDVVAGYRYIDVDKSRP